MPLDLKDSDLSVKSFTLWYFFSLPFLATLLLVLVNFE